MVFNKDTKLFTLTRLLDKIIIANEYDPKNSLWGSHELFARSVWGPEKFTVISQLDWEVLEPIIKVICQQFDLKYGTTERINQNVTVGFTKNEPGVQ